MRMLARYDEPIPDECLSEDAQDNANQVQRACDSCINLRRSFNRMI